MSTKVKNIDIKNHTYYIFDGVVNIKKFDSSKLILLKSHRKILLFTTLNIWQSKNGNNVKLIV